MPLDSQDFQYLNYTPTEFEQFRSAIEQDGFTITQNSIDTVAGHLGSLTYLTANYNRNQQILLVTIKTSPWQSFQKSDLKANVLRVVKRDQTAAEAGHAPVNTTPVKSPTTPAGTGVAPQTGNIVVPPVAPKVTTPANPTVGTETPTPTQQIQAAIPPPEPKKPEVDLKTSEDVKPAEPEKPVPVQTPKPAQAATTDLPKS